MNRAYVCALGFLALVLMAFSARAGTTTITLTQTARPITRAYPGVDASVLGIRPGMTLSQAEALAAKRYPKKTPGSAFSLSLYFKGGELQTSPMAPTVRFSKTTGRVRDHLDLHATTPALGSTIYGVTRTVDFSAGSGNTVRFPPIDAIEASLIRKYGPPSYKHNFGPSMKRGMLHGDNGTVVLAWVFSKSARLTCQSLKCVGPTMQLGLDILPMGTSKSSYDESLRQVCGTSAGSPAVFKILAAISRTGKGQATANSVWVSMWDTEACMNDGDQAWNQLHAAVAKLTAPKPQARFPGASESVPPGSGPFSFYGDIGNNVGPGTNNPLLVRPSTLYLTENGSVALLHLHWSDWGKGIARAKGVWAASNCTPDCADGKVTKIPTRLTLWRPGRVGGHWVYECFRIDPQHPKRDILDHACISGGEYQAFGQ